MNGGGAFCIARYSYISSAWPQDSIKVADLLELYRQLHWPGGTGGM